MTSPTQPMHFEALVQLSDGDVEGEANLVGTPAARCPGEGSTRRPNPLVPGGSSGRSIWPPRRWRRRCFHLHWYCPKSPRRSRHHTGRPSSPRKASRRRARLFLRHRSCRRLRRRILGAGPEEGGGVGLKKGSVTMNIYSSVCALSFTLKDVMFCTWDRWKLPWVL